MAILITSGSSAASHQLKNQLANNTIIIGDYHELPEFMLKSGNMIRLPNPVSNSYTHEMLALCLDKHIEKVYILRQEEADILLLSNQLFNEYGIEIINYSGDK